MKKILCTLLAVMFFMSCFSVLVFAEGGIDLADQKKVLLIEDRQPWDSDANKTVLNKIKANYNTTTTSNFSADMLKDYGVVILANDQTTATYGAYERFTSELESFARNGGTVVYGACDNGWGGGTLSSTIIGGIKKAKLLDHYNIISDRSHPIVTGTLTDSHVLTNSDLYSNYCSHTYFFEDSLPIGCNIILRSKSNNAPTLIEYDLGEGKIIASGLTWEHNYVRHTGADEFGTFANKAMDDYFAYAILHYNSTVKFTVDNVGIKADFRYNDTFFNQSSYIYNHNLAKASIGLATAAMVSDGGDYANKAPTAAKKLFEDIGFENYTPNGYNKKPTENSIACVFANKNIDATRTSIVAIAIRGGGYEGEWSGNFNVGDSTIHEGFDIAKRTVISYLYDFLRTKKNNEEIIKYKDNVKFWVTGYSRSAAVANLVCSCLDKVSANSGMLDDGQACYLLDDFSFAPKDIYGYTFETPRNTRDTQAKTNIYQNIFNIVNRDDVVPRVAPAAWGYVRYGKDCYLPSIESMKPKKYNKLYEKMKEVNREIAKKEDKKEYKGDCSFYELKMGVTDLDVLVPWPEVKIKENKSLKQGTYLDKMLNYLANVTIGSSKEYVKKYQDSVTKLVYTIKGNPQLDNAIRTESFGQYIIDHISLKNITLNPLKEALKNALVLYGSDAGMNYKEASSLVESFDWILRSLVVHPNYLLTLFKNMGNLFVPHYTETTMAWMIALGGTYENEDKAISEILTGGETYRIATINCPVDIKVYDTEGVLVGAIIDDEVQEVEDGISAFIDENGQKCFCMPNEENYRFSIVGNGEGTMTCSFADYNYDTCEKTTVANYYDIPITTDTTLTATLDKKSDDGISEDIVITDNKSDEVILQSEVLDLQDEEAFSVITGTNSAETFVFGGGEYYKGEYAKVTAVPSEKSLFAGWYENNALVSSEMEYRFRVESNRELTAKYVSVSIGDFSLGYKSSTTIKPEINAEDESSYTVSYTSSNPSVATVDNNGKVTSVKQFGLNRGSATITVTVTDNDGNSISDTCNVTVEYAWWQWLIKIVLFGWIWY